MVGRRTGIERSSHPLPHAVRAEARGVHARRLSGEVIIVRRVAYEARHVAADARALVFTAHWKHGYLALWTKYMSGVQ
jgi:hypothetical protein